MTLAKARAEANKAFQEARDVVLIGRVSARSASENLIGVFWNLNHQLASYDKGTFLRWFEKKHDALGKELGAK